MRRPHIILAICAVLAASSQTHAEDAVVPDEFDQLRAAGVCDRYGTGFVQFPSTNTCVKVGGQVRYEKRFSNRGSATGGQTRLEFETRSD